MRFFLTAAASLVYVAFVATLAGIDQSDAAGNGLSFSYAILQALLLWTLLALLLVLAMRSGTPPAWAKWAAVLLLPLSLAAALNTTGLLLNRGGASGWPIVMPAVVPALLIAYSAWLAFPSLRTLGPADATHRAVWSIVLLLSLIPFPLRSARARALEATQAEREAVGRAQEDNARRELEARLDSLTPERPLRDWLAFATAGHDLRERTLERIRQLPDRQRQAEAMRGDDRALLMSELRNLGWRGGAISLVCSTGTTWSSASTPIRRSGSGSSRGLHRCVRSPGARRTRARAFPRRTVRAHRPRRSRSRP